MKKIIKKSIKDQSGHGLLIVLVLMLVGVLIITPLLGFMSAGLKAGQVHEERLLQLYAADSGVEYGMQQIIIKPDDLPQTQDAPPLIRDIIDVNGKLVDPISVTYIDSRTYKINSTATEVTTGANTTIESYVQILSFSNFLFNVITSLGDVEIQPNSIVEGDVQYNGDLVNRGTIDDEDGVSEDPIEGWPDFKLLHLYYWPEVEASDSYPDDEINLENINIGNTVTIPTLYRVGDLTVTNTGSSGATGFLSGTVYITGDLDFKQTGSRDYHIYLNGQTIFVLGEVDFPSDRVTLHGPGCIVAMGDINFQPKMASIDEDEPNDLIFVMSVEGTVNFQPNGDFHGSLAGDVKINLQPGTSLVWNGPPPTLKFPGAEPSERNVIYAIRTWEIGL